MPTLTDLHWSNTHQNPNRLHCQKWTPYKVRVAFCKPICATKARIGQPSPNQGIFTASHNSHHVHVTLQVAPHTGGEGEFHVCYTYIDHATKKYAFGLNVHCFFQSIFFICPTFLIWFKNLFVEWLHSVQGTLTARVSQSVRKWIFLQHCKCPKVTREKVMKTYIYPLISHLLDYPVLVIRILPIIHHS